MTPTREDAAWQHPGRGPGREELLEPSTQIVADREAYLGQGRHDVGRRISDDQVELFVAGDVAMTLQREFTQHAAEFLALHDVGLSASLRLLTSLAGAAGARVQRMSIRRQGQGVALAVLQFVEMPLSDGMPVRVYSTDLNADSLTRAQVSRVLLSQSRLGVLLVGELPPHALASQLAPLHEALRAGPWPNRELLMVPLGSGTALAAQAAQLATGSSVAVHVTPHASKPRQAWSYIGGAWNRLNATPSGTHAIPTDLARAVPRPVVPRFEAPTEPMPLEPSAPARAATPPSAPQPMPRPGSSGQWQGYAERCLAIKGGVACCVFDMHDGKSVAHAGGPPAADRMVQQGSALLVQLHETARALGLGAGGTEATVSTSTNHLLLRAVQGHPGIVIILVVSATSGNLTLARMQLERTAVPQ